MCADFVGYELSIERLVHACRSDGTTERLALPEADVLAELAGLESAALRGIRKYRIGYWLTDRRYSLQPERFYLMGR